MGVAITVECAKMLWVWLLEWDVGDMAGGCQGSSLSLTGT